jgi:hypothetical protein
VHRGVDMRDKPYDLRERSFLFACDIVAFSRIVADRGYILSRLATQALKESREARFWLRLIAASEPSLAGRSQPLISEASEFVAMLTASVKTSRSNPHRGWTVGLILGLALFLALCF